MDKETFVQQVIGRKNVELRYLYDDFGLANLFEPAGKDNDAYVWYAVHDKDTGEESVVRIVRAYDFGVFCPETLHMVLPFANREITECSDKVITHNNNLNTYGLFSLNNEKFIYPEIYDLIEYSEHFKAYLYMKNGKKGLWYCQGLQRMRTQDTIPAKYDEIEIAEGYEKSIIKRVGWESKELRRFMYKVRQDVKWGARCYFQELNSRYDAFEDRGFSQLGCRQYIVPCKFDDISVLRTLDSSFLQENLGDVSDKQFLVKMKGKYGVYDHNVRGYLVQPIFNRPIYRLLLPGECKLAFNSYSLTIYKDNSPTFYTKKDKNEYFIIRNGVVKSIKKLVQNFSFEDTEKYLQENPETEEPDEAEENIGAEEYL